MAVAVDTLLTAGWTLLHADPAICEVTFRPHVDPVEAAALVTTVPEVIQDSVMVSDLEFVEQAHQHRRLVARGQVMLERDVLPKRQAGFAVAELSRRSMASPRSGRGIGVGRWD